MYNTHARNFRIQFPFQLPDYSFFANLPYKNTVRSFRYLSESDTIHNGYYIRQYVYQVCFYTPHFLSNFNLECFFRRVYIPYLSICVSFGLLLLFRRRFE